MNDRNIIGGQIVRPEGVRQGDIGIKDGVIRQISWGDSGLDPAKETYNAGGLLIFPGMIDSHVHIRGGALSHREDFTTGSYAAAASGITTILEMPNCATPASSVENFLLRKEEIKRLGCVNFGMYGGAGADNIPEIPKLARQGAIGYKTFHMSPVRGREREFYGLCALSDDDLLAVMTVVEKTGLPLTIHCESQPMVSKLEADSRARGENGLRAFCDSRPVQAELESVTAVLAAAKATGCRVIIAHVSAPETVALVLQEKEQGVNVYIESCTHYLCFDIDEMEQYGPFARMKPPWRDRNRKDRMVKLYADGFVDITGSDHAPYAKQEKLKGGDDIWDAFDGLYGLEMTLPLLLKLVEDGILKYETIARSFSQNTAEIFGLAGKGRIQEGKDADLVFVRRLSKKVPFNIKNLHIKCADAAVIYDGIPMGHQVERTMLGGRFAYQNGAVDLTPGMANILTPKRI